MNMVNSKKKKNEKHNVEEKHSNALKEQVRRASVFLLGEARTVWGE